VVSHFFRSLPPVDTMDFATLRKITESRVAAKLPSGAPPLRWTELSQVSRAGLYAIVLSEDATFFEHDGINVDAMLDSLAENLKERRAAYGASTITQQVAKNLFLTSEKSFTRKLKELFVTAALERHFTKNQILEAYFNVAEFGPDLYGIDAAARHFFKVRPDALNAAQGAFLALMLPSPRRNYFSIWQNRNLTRVKRRRIDRVLRDMLYEEYLTEAQFREMLRFNYFPQDSARRATASRPR
jgi:monofunctional biosynthetic peptidoglycan transglycosylase